MGLTPSYIQLLGLEIFMMVYAVKRRSCALSEVENELTGLVSNSSMREILDFFREMEKRGYIEIEEVKTAGKNDFFLKPTDEFLKEFNITNLLLDRMAMIKALVDRVLPVSFETGIFEETAPGKIYNLIVSAVRGNLSEGVEIGVVSRLLEEVGDYAKEEDSGFIICSLVVRLTVLLGVRDPRIRRALNMLEKFEEERMRGEDSLFWSKVMIYVAEANILYGRRSRHRAEKIFRKLEGYPNIPLENMLLLKAKIASLKMLISVDSCVEMFRGIAQEIKENYSSYGKGPYIKERGELLLTVLNRIGDCMKMEGGLRLKTLYFDLFNFLKSRLKGGDLSNLYYSLGSLLSANRYTLSNPELIETVFDFWEKEVDSVVGAKYFKLDKFKHMSEFMLHAMRLYSEKQPDMLESILKADVMNFGLNIDDSSNIFEEVLINLWSRNKKINLDKLFMLLDQAGSGSKRSRGKGKGWHPPEYVMSTLKDLIWVCSVTGNMDVLEKMEEKIGSYPTSLEKLALLAEILYAQALQGGKYEKDVLKVVESTKEIVKKLVGPLYPDQLNTQQLDKIAKITLIVDTLGKILAITMNPNIVKPIVELCSEIPPHYDYFSIRNLLEAMIWQIKSTKQGIEYNRCTEYN